MKKPTRGSPKTHAGVVLAQTMMYGPPNMGTCDCSFRNESLSTIIAEINQLAFLTSTGMIDQESITFPTPATGANSGFSVSVPNPVLTANTSTPLTIKGVASNSTTFFRQLDGTVQISDVSFYQTHFLYLGLGVGLTLFCAATVTSLFWRYGTLGRDVSMGPIEIAGAFGSPILSTTTHTEPTSPHERAATDGRESPGSSPASLEKRPHRPVPILVNATALSKTPPSPSLQTSPAAVSFANMDDLLATVGSRRVMYGMVDVENDHRQPPSPLDGTMLAPPSGPSSPDGLHHRSSVRRSQIMTFGHAADEGLKPAYRKSFIGASKPPASPR